MTHTPSDFLSKRAKRTEIRPHIHTNSHTKCLIRTRFSIMLITFYNSRDFFSCARSAKIPKKSFAMNTYNLHTQMRAHIHIQANLFEQNSFAEKGLRCSIPFIAHTLGACIDVWMCVRVYLHMYLYAMNANVCIYNIRLVCVCVAFLHTLMMPALHFHFRLISLPIHCSTRFHQNIFI